jgi:anaerobic magnesium-protoporphyrin IX monomethyl ester cyclase
MSRIMLIKVGHPVSRQKFGPPLGIMSLAAYMRLRFPEYEFQLHDMLPERLSIKDLVKLVDEFSPDILGISAMTFEREELHGLAKAVKARHPGLPIVAGGAHATTVPEKVLEDENIDLMVRGEGEETFADLVPRMLAGEKKPDIPGVGFRKHGKPYLAPPRPFIENLDELPFPAWDLINMPIYWEIPRFATAYVHKRYMSLTTSRGCPYQCTYCHRVFGRAFRAQSPQRVIRELKALYHGYGIREVHFVDDCFNCDKKRAGRICDLIAQEDLKLAINFPNGLRGDILDDELLDKLKAAGTYRITYAVESGTERVQKFMKKHLKLEVVKEVISKTDARGIMVDGFFMVGFPGETREEIEKTLSYALNSRLHSVNIFFVTAFEGTELYQQAREMGLEVKIPSDSYTYYYPESNLSEVPPEKLKKMVQRTFIRFYLNPWRLYRTFILFPNKLQLPYLLWLFIKYTVKWI